MPIRINILSKAEKVPAQGVGSASIEHNSLVNLSKELEISINSKKNDFDIFHIHSVHLEHRLRMNKKHINIVDVHFIPRLNSGSVKLIKPAEWLLYTYTERMYRKADEIVVVNPIFIKEIMKIGIPEEKITYMPNYVDKANFYNLGLEKRLEIRKKHDIDENKFVVLGCGQIQTRKGVEDFVEIAKKCPDMLFIWAGGFPFGKITHGYKKFKKIVANPPANVRFIGIISREEMNEIYNMSDVLLLPSFMELFPMTILESCNVGLPLLLRDLDLYKPILFDKYCRGSSIEGFIEQLIKLQNENDYYLKSSQNSLEISNYYSKERVLGLWEEYYQRIHLKYKKQEGK